jgi:peroxiredoxin
MRALKMTFAHLSLLALAVVPACGASQSDEPAPAPAATDSSETASPAPAAQTAAAPAPAAAPEATPPAAGASEAAPGAPAPDFTLPDLDGKKVSLSSFRGKTVVLEWFNPGCPFVRYAHAEGPLKDLAKKQAAKGTVWLAINSGAPGKQGHGADLNRKASQEWGMEHPVLLDESGQTGKAYGAKATPGMYVIDAKGQVVYKGGLDNAPLGKAPSEGLVNYVDKALAAVAAGKPVEVAETKQYGCSVKYASE